MVMFSIICMDFFRLEAAQAGYLMSAFGVLLMVSEAGRQGGSGLGAGLGFPHCCPPHLLLRALPHGLTSPLGPHAGCTQALSTRVPLTAPRQAGRGAGPVLGVGRRGRAPVRPRRAWVCRAQWGRREGPPGGGPGLTPAAPQGPRSCAWCWERPAFKPKSGSRSARAGPGLSVRSARPAAQRGTRERVVSEDADDLKEVF